MENLPIVSISHIPDLRFLHGFFASYSFFLLYGFFPARFLAKLPSIENKPDMGLVAKLVATLIVVNFKLGSSSLQAECCQSKDSKSQESGNEGSDRTWEKCEISSEREITENKTEKADLNRVPVGIIYTGDVGKDQALVQLLQTVQGFEEEVRLQPMYALQNSHVNSSASSQAIANAYIQLCVYFRSQEMGSFRPYLVYMSQWLSTGLRPSSSYCSQPFASAIPYPLERYLSHLPAPGLLIANRYLPASPSPTDLLGQLCPEYLDQSQNSSKSTRALETECSPGCSPNNYKSTHCFPACNVSGCAYQNWTCTCAVGCTPTLLSNDVCDRECDIAACNFDNNHCYSYEEHVPYTNPNQPNSEEASWAKWVIVALCVLTTSFFLGITFYCYIRQHVIRNRYALTSLNRLNITASVSPMTVGQDSDFLSPGKIIFLLGKRIFSQEIVVFGDAMCVVCLAE